MLPDKREVAEDALKFLHAHSVGSLATASPDGQPYVTPVYFAVLPDFSLYFATSHHSGKFKNLTINPRVAFSVGTGPDYTSVSIAGKAHLLEKEEMAEALRLLRTSVDTPLSAWPIQVIKALENGGVAVFKIEPETVNFLNLNSEAQLQSAAKYIYTILP